LPQNLPLNHAVEVHVVRWPVNAIAPFEFSFEGDNITFYERKNFTVEQLLSLAKKINPDLILCSGWTDKGYNSVCSFYNGKIHTILGIDNPWRKTFKQRLASFIGPLVLRKYFSHCWVPGESQEKYARKLGFKKSNIKQGIYSCDFNAFHSLYLSNKNEKKVTFPKRIIFVGRYTKLKGTAELWEAFVKFQQQHPCEWELWCLGKGDMDEQFPKHDKIKNFGFVQPSEMKKFVRDCGVFILPSHYEHWGVVVHEFAAAGFPLICTTSTGAATVFLKDGYNGYFVQPYDVNSITEALIKIANATPAELLLMGDRSAEMARKITPDKWADTLMDFFNN